MLYKWDHAICILLKTKELLKNRIPESKHQEILRRYESIGIHILKSCENLLAIYFIQITNNKITDE